jgi:HK97 gp10 family phage protein|tara:strand:+ start:283 stop:747 length:465 start_codon:yes stop_codon:yes gene_type:complete
MSVKSGKSKDIQVFGLDNVNKLLVELVPKEAEKLSKGMIVGFAQHAAKLIRAKAPVGKTGNLKKAIKGKNIKSSPGAPMSKVVITKGNFVKNDAFYWRFVEYGTGGKNVQPAREFIYPAMLQMRSQMDRLVDQIFTKKLAAAVKRAKKKAAKLG